MVVECSFRGSRLVVSLAGDNEGTLFFIICSAMKVFFFLINDLNDIGTL